MKTKILFALTVMFFLQLLLIMSCDKNETETVCDFDEYHATTGQKLIDAGLLEPKTHGSESFQGPKFLVVNLDINSILNPDEYTTRIWLMSLWNIAVQMAVRSGEFDELQKNYENAELIAFFKDRMNDVKGLSELAKWEQARELTPIAGTIAEKFGKGLLDILEKLKIFKPNATIHNAYGRLGTLATGLGLFLIVCDAMNEMDKIKLILNSSIAWKYFEIFVRPAILENPIFSNNPSISLAIKNYHDAPETFSSAQYDLINTGVLVDVSSIIIGSAAVGAAAGSVAPVAGNLAGAVAGVATGIAIGLTAEQIKQGGTFILYNDIASRLFTLTLYSSSKDNDRQSFLQAYSLFIALDFINNTVIGKGLPQVLGGIIGLFFQTEESKWHDFLDQNHNTQQKESWNNCFKTFIDNLETKNTTLSVSVHPISTMPLVGITPIVSYETVNNKIYLFGLAVPPYMTQSTPTTASNQIRTYDLVSNTWATLPFNLPYGIYAQATATYFNNHFYLGPGYATGNVNGWGSHNKMIDVNLSNNTAQETSNQFSSGRIWLVCSKEVNGKMYFFGGWNGSGVNSIFEFIPTSNAFKQVASLMHGRAGVAPILGNDGWIYIIGSLSTIERFNPTTYQVQTMNATLPGTMYYVNCWNIKGDNSIYFFNSDATINPIVYKYNYSTDVLTNTGLTLSGTFESRCIMDSNDPFSIYGFKHNPNNTTPLQIVKISLSFK